MEQLTYYLLALLLPLLLLKLIARRDGNGMRLPPGPWQLPVIGSLHHLLGSPLPHRAMARIARRLGAPPFIYLRLGEVPVVVASSPAAAREVMKTHDARFATRPWTPTTRVLVEAGEGLVFARYGALWRQLRRISVLELLSARRVHSFRAVREEEARRLVAAVAAAAAGEGGGAVNVSKRIAVVVTDTAVRAIIGDRFERREEFLANLAEGVKITSGFNLCDLFPSSMLVRLVSGTERRARETHRRHFELMDLAIKQHEQRRAAAMAQSADGTVEKEEDLIDVLLRIQREGGLEVPLTMGMIKTVILDMFGAGSETSANTLQWAMSELARNPEVMHKAQAEVREKLQGKPMVAEDDLADLRYTKLIIKETLRLHPAVPLLVPRECRESCKVMGYDVPRGTTVFVNVWAISRDPGHWGADAAAFRPERFEAGTAADFKGTDFEFTPFGAGRRMCPGMAFAQASMELALAVLLYHFDWEMPGGMLPGELDMTEEMGIAVRRKNDLYLRPVVRVPPHVTP
ncbi:desmethyl-deoxy-podophyllotoxin synthase-like [Panicum virgatum]|uniref:Cytochrome P450 n=1 Tax=Panicum virgatum TaxID=38727 RepID=A0A8T0XBR6_PANVG|nr:desmethyl-deoxy-podophyllotoxin synthase-like [Panicum virgatum]KAG2656547.1 hypothetical protein PVAP13_1KG091700 [Panicum virgatum]